MKIGNIQVKVSALVMGVVAFFTILFLFAFFGTSDAELQRQLLWAIPLIAGMALMALALNYMSQRSYSHLVPIYEQEAKKVRIHAINLNMLGDVVRIEGVVERVYFQFLNRPQYLIADRSGDISVKMFTTPQENVKKGDIVEVLGSVMKRYILTGDAIVNAVSIRKIEQTNSKPVKKSKE
ncbi:MAG TPA: nucleotide-binding protein [Methanomicrobiales archaeon]|nr:nucleotide-binding protein [Methanomicrobiales archaeon]